MIWSARASTDCGIVSPIALAVLSVHDVLEGRHRRQPALDGQLSHALSLSEEHPSAEHQNGVCARSGHRREGVDGERRGEQNKGGGDRSETHCHLRVSPAGAPHALTELTARPLRSGTDLTVSLPRRV
jgi:hypothetical protein